MRHVFPLINTIQNYDWGSPFDIPEMTGLPNPQDRPMAELWMGAHPKAPSLAGPEGSSVTLNALIEGDPAVHLGAAVKFGTLPYLFKFLAAAKPLSIQAHPNREQARDGWERENRSGLTTDAPNRNYKDANHKPEILCALTNFRAMCGFRRPQDIGTLLDALGVPELKTCRNSLKADSLGGALKAFLVGLFSFPEFERVALTERIGGRARELIADCPAYPREWAMTDRFSRLYPGDPTILAPLYLNIVDLKPGEAVFLPSGILHAYVEGFGVELMANSDNVLRGGLTPKHIDLDELVHILQFEPYVPDILGTDDPTAQVYIYDTPAEEFSLTRFSYPRGVQTLPRGIPYIVVVTDGSLKLSDGTGESLFLGKGNSAFISAGAPSPSLDGHFTAYVAGTGMRRA